MLLKCNNLCYTYPGNDTPVLHDLSFELKAPGFKALFGPSGSGKTTAARLIASKDEALGNSIETKGIDTILYSYNLERLPGWSTTGHHLNQVTAPEKQTLKEDLVRIFEMEHLLDARFSQLSLGQQNRINLIRYLLQDFNLLILDESLANVDEKLRQTIILAVKDLFPDKMFLYISHNLMEVSRFCGDILVFSQPSEKKGYTLVNGLDLMTGDHSEQKHLDSVILEIMNAF